MRDKLKRHIEKNRNEFEVYDTDYDFLWEGIEEKLKENAHKKKNKFLKYTLRIAASIIILLTVGVAFKIGQQSVLINKNGMALHDVSEEMAETESYYSNLIKQKMDFIKSNSDEVNQDTWQALDQLDNDYQQLKKDLNDQAGSEEVIEAMINYYRLKLEMLEQISGELQDKKQNDEDINI